MESLKTKCFAKFSCHSPHKAKDGSGNAFKFRKEPRKLSYFARCIIHTLWQVVAARGWGLEFGAFEF